MLEIAKKFDYACREVVNVHPGMIPHAEELIEFARNHERKQVCLLNVCQQVAQYSRSANKFRPGRRKKTNAEIRRQQNLLIAAAAQMFMLAIKTQRDQANWSEATKILRTSTNATREQMASILKEVPPDTREG